MQTQIKKKTPFGCLFCKRDNKRPKVMAGKFGKKNRRIKLSCSQFRQPILPGWTGLGNNCHRNWFRQIETQKYKVMPIARDNHIPIRSHKNATAQTYNIHDGTT